MEVAIGSNSNNVAPFQREVREWQRVDSNTGAYLSGRLEADRWINGSLNAYGKVVNSQNISNQNGSIKQSQRNQLEVLQARTSSGSLQVVRAQTVQTMTSTSSSHCWTSSSSSLPSSSSSSPTKTKALALTGATSTYHVNQKNNTFDNQRFATNPRGYQLQQKLKPQQQQQQQQKEHHHQQQQQQQQQQKSRHLTNGNILTDSHDDDHLTTPPLNSSHHNNRHTFVTAPSVKLSTLMKSNAAAAAAATSNTTTIATIKNDEGRNSPHFLSNSMSLLQQRQQHQNDHHYYTEHEQQQQQQPENQHESESQSSSFTTDSRYHLLPTMRVGEVRVGVEIINTNQMEPLRNERETTTLGHSHINHHEQQEEKEEEGDENENEEYEEESLSQHHRGRSVSTDDLATEWNQNDNDDESSEWRRVSKIRRSFQFPKSTSPKINISRPSDLPENSGSVSRIRNELENGRRLNTAMRNNNVDLVALNNILNGTRENDNKITKKATFLTAESLKEIRGKLKKLSDETLYKDDFITQTNIDDEENMNVTNTRLDNGTNVYSIQQPIVLHDAQVVQQSQQSSFQYQPKFEGNYTTNSLESRTKYRDTNSSEWHLRRKSYGFEKMTSSENPMFRMETSTDSGIGRSGDLANWSPTENTAAAGATAITTATSKNLSSSNPVTIVENRSNNTQKTTVKLTNDDNTRIFERPVIVQRRLHPGKIDEPEIIKRHSIAVDEVKYVGGENMRKTFETKLSSIHVNGFTNTKDTNILQINTSGSATTADETGRRQKRVEFCKTEVHFAAESGRVNIVETDGKPPPTNNFRRRRRSQSSSSSSSSTTLLSTLPGNNNLNNSYLDTINSGMPLIHFGDEKKAIFDQQENDLGEIKDHKNNITISIPIKSVNDNNNSNSNSNSDRIMIPKTTSIVEIEDESSNSEEVSLRSILKNKPIKPKPYHLGESIDPAGESLWGVRLRPIVTTTKIDQQDVKDRTTCIRMISPPQEIDHKESFEPIKSVAERIKIVEERKDGSGYSTKINLNISDSPYSWNVPEFSKMNIMSIELHSPSSSITRIVPTEDIPKKIEIPIPKPRTVSPVKFARNILDNEHKSISNIQHNDTEYRQIKKSIESNSDKKEPLKVVTGGARKLREHELSYFGIKKDDSQNQKTKSSQRISNHAITNSVSNNHNNNNHAINNKKVLNILEDDQIQKWKLSSDKPDLLRHSPVASKRNKLPQGTELDKQKINDDGPIYENLKKPSTYNRKKDLKRDEMILNEMTKTADLTMKTVTNCSKQTTDQDHSQHHRSTKPLDTIDEKAAVSRPSSNNSLKKIKSKAMQSSRYPTTSDHFQRACCSNRPSSASSIESLNRYPKSSKSRSQSKESSSGKIEYANIRSTKKLTTTSARNENNKSRHRSQSRERHHHHHQQRTRSQSHHSSSDDFENSPKVELIPRIRKPTKSRGGGGLAVEKNTSTTSNSGTKENEHKRTAMMAKRTTTKSISENFDHRYKNQAHQNLRSISDDRNVKPTRRTTTTANIEKTDKISLSKRSSPALTNNHHNHTISSDSSTINNHYSKIRQRSTSSGIVSSTSSPSKHRTIKEHTRK